MDILRNFIAIVDGVKLTTISVLIVANFILGVLLALKSGVFKWERLADFLDTNVLYYLGGYFVTGILVLVRPEFIYAATGAAVLIITSLTAAVLNKLKALGLLIPDTLPPIKPA
jgi:hypothetical protein